MRAKLFSFYMGYKKLLNIFASVLILVIVGSKVLSLGWWAGTDSVSNSLSKVAGANLEFVAYQNQHGKSDDKQLPDPNKNKQVFELNKSQKAPTANSLYQTTEAFRQYQPQYAVVLPHESNYGDRFSQDAYGNPVSNIPLVVLHETVGSAQSAINTFRNNHPNDNQQVSYHALITLDGTVIYLVPPDKRAFGAGNSAFRGDRGVEAVKTNPNLPASVNNFAYHVSLETPVDGRGKHGNRRSHSGYTTAQYKSLAWLIAQSNIPSDRITTHREVDLAGYKMDPRSFDFAEFVQILDSYRQPLVGKAAQ